MSGLQPSRAVHALYVIAVLNSAMKPAAPPVFPATRLLNQVRERIRYKHYSFSTQQTSEQAGRGSFNDGFAACIWLTALGRKRPVTLLAPVVTRK